MKSKTDQELLRSAHGSPRGSRLIAVIVGGLLTMGVLFASLALQKFAPPTGRTSKLSSEGIFNRTNILTIHLKFTPDQWETMEPKGGPGRGPGGPGGFGPSMFLAPTFLREGDSNHDGKFSQVEFAALGRKWFDAWDTNQSGKLDATKIRAGIDKIMAPPPNGGQGGPGGPPGPGRPGGAGPGGPGGGLGLQGPEGKRNGLASAMGIEYVYVHADLDLEGQLLPNVAVRYKGNGTFLESRGSLKRSLKIDLGKYSQGNKLNGVSKINLQNNVTDASWMNEALSYRLYQDAGVPTPRTAFARVYVTVPGKFDKKFLGLYSLSETIDKHFAEQRFGTKRGAIFKPVTPALFTDLGSDWSKYKQAYDPKQSIHSEETERVMEFAKFCSHASEAEFATRLGEYIDLDEFARYMAVTVWLSDMDGILGPGQNFYLHLHPRTQLFDFIPWDQDHSFGQMRGTQEEREKLSIDHPWQGENRFLERVYKVAAFQKLYRKHMTNFIQTIFRPERLANQVNELAAVIRPAVAEESNDKLERFDKVVAGESVSGGGFGMFGGDGPKPIKPFSQKRTRSVVNQLAGRTAGMTLGGSGFPGPGGGGRGPGGPGGPGGPQGGFGPGMFLGGAFVDAFDQDHDSTITRDEVDQAFVKWFTTWGEAKSEALTETQLRAGIDKDLSPFRNGPPGGGMFPGPPPEDN